VTDQLNRAVDRAVAEPGGSAATAVSTATRPTGSHKAAVRTRVPPVWTSLLSAGYPQQNLIWFTKPNADQQVDRRVPNWHAINYMVSSDIIRTSRQNGGTVKDALLHSRPVARWGSGSHEIEIRKVGP